MATITCEVFAARFYYVTFVLANGVHAGVYVRVEAGEQILMRRTAAAIGALFDGQVCHALSAAEVTEREMPVQPRDIRCTAIEITLKADVVSDGDEDAENRKQKVLVRQVLYLESAKPPAQSAQPQT